MKLYELYKRQEKPGVQVVTNNIDENVVRLDVYKETVTASANAEDIDVFVMTEDEAKDMFNQLKALLS